MKYLIRARVEVEGIVDKHDVIGALFGQMEGLLPELDLRELQERGRIGRIHVDIKPEDGKVKGEIKIPSNLGKVETALIAALIETIDKVGPYPAKIQLVKIADLRVERLRKAVERAKEILRTWREEIIELKEVVKEIEESLRPAEIVEYGEDRLPAGPGIDKSDTVIMVEGRADVLNLLRHGYDNVIAFEGARGGVPKTLKELAEKKKVILFVDGDRAGELIARELVRAIKVDYVARAPPGREVEDLTGKEIAQALEKKIPAQQFLQQVEAAEREKAREAAAEQLEVAKQVQAQAAPQQQAALAMELPREVVEEAKSLRGTLEATLFDREWKKVKRIPVRDLYQELKSVEPGSVRAVVFDGIITQRLVDVASEKMVELLLGARIGNISKRGEGVLLLTVSDIVG